MPPALCGNRLLITRELGEAHDVSERGADLALLGLAAGEPVTHDQVRRAYLRRLRLHPPERDPVGFRRLREAFERLEPWARLQDLLRAATAERDAAGRAGRNDADEFDDPGDVERERASDVERGTAATGKRREASDAERGTTAAERSIAAEVDRGAAAEGDRGAAAEVDRGAAAEVDRG